VGPIQRGTKGTGEDGKLIMMVIWYEDDYVGDENEDYKHGYDDDGGDGGGDENVPAVPRVKTKAGTRAFSGAAYSVEYTSWQD